MSLGLGRDARTVRGTVVDTGSALRRLIPVLHLAEATSDFFKIAAHRDGVKKQQPAARCELVRSLSRETRVLAARDCDSLVRHLDDRWRHVDRG